MKTKPMIFCGDMIRAFVDGRKTMTRRLDGLEEINKDPDAWQPPEFSDSDWVFFAAKRDVSWKLRTIKSGKGVYVRCPYPVGQIRWFRETWCLLDDDHWFEPSKPKDWLYTGALKRPSRNACAYRADCDADSERCRIELGYKWRPSIHMPRWASRLSRRVEGHDHRCQRLQDISREDCFDEGVGIPEGLPEGFSDWEIKGLFFEIWDRLNGRRAGGIYHSSRSPWVWAVKLGEGR